MSIVLVDLDGTISNTAQRESLLAVKPRHWEAYSAAHVDDELIAEVAEVVRGLRVIGWRPVFVSGRSRNAFETTVEWLSKHGLWQDEDELFMREPGDNTPNADLKLAFAEHVISKIGHVGLAIDDHPGVARVYAEQLGLTTLVVVRPGADKGILNELADNMAAQGTQLPPFVQEALNEARDTFARKNADYAKDNAWRSNFDAIADQMGFDAVTAADTLIAVKQARLAALATNGRTPINEGVKDTYLDRMVYSIIAYALYLDEESKA